MSESIIRNSQTTCAIEEVLDSLMRENSSNRLCYNKLLRNKASFTSQFSNDKFIETCSKLELNKDWYNNLVKKMVRIFKTWVSQTLGVSINERFYSERGITITERDIFGHEYSGLLDDGEEYDVDNILL